MQPASHLSNIALSLATIDAIVPPATPSIQNQKSASKRTAQHKDTNAVALYT
jgi:hypothetical protein